MKKLFIIILLISIFSCYADKAGIYLGGGIGYGQQYLSANNISNTQSSPTIRLFGGYQFADWIAIEGGYTYITQSTNWNNYGNPSTTIYDLSFTPGFTLPDTLVTFYGRLGLDGISANLNNNWFNQIFSNLTAQFEIGGGVKINIPTTPAFIRAEYIYFGAAPNNDNSSITTQAGSFLLTAGYIF